MGRKPEAISLTKRSFAEAGQSSHISEIKPERGISSTYSSIFNGLIIDLSLWGIYGDLVQNAQLHGNWKEDVLFELRQVLEAYDFYRKQITDCDQELKRYTATVPTREITEKQNLPTDASPLSPSKKARRPKNTYNRRSKPNFDLASELQRTMGVDLTRIDGIDVITAQVIFSEIGPDLSAFPNENHFASWLTLSPKNDISGGKVIRRVPAAGRNRVANSLRMAAQSLSRSDSYLGARYRRLRARLDGSVAVKAMARYLACLVYRMVTKGQPYVDRGAAHYEAKRKEKERVALQRRAALLGLKLVPAA